MKFISTLIAVFLIFPAFFGGRIIAIIPTNPTCPLPLVVFGPPMAGTFALSTTTKVYKFGRIRPGVWALGKASSGVACGAPILRIGTGK